MPRIPTSFYLSILAGIIVLFNHYVASETGGVALNKVTGAADRFYTLFRDTALAVQRDCTSRFETALFGPAVDGILLHGAAERIRTHYCHLPVLDSETVGGTSNDRQHHGGDGGSDFAYHQLPMKSLGPRWSESAEDPLRRSLFSLDWSSQSCLSQAVWDRSSEAMVTVGALLLRTYASWWWFRAPLKMAGVLLAACAAWSALGYLFGVNTVVQYVAQVHMVIVTDFLQYIEWEAQRKALNIGVMMMERAYGLSRMSVNTHK